MKTNFAVLLYFLKIIAGSLCFLFLISWCCMTMFSNHQSTTTGEKPYNPAVEDETSLIYETCFMSEEVVKQMLKAPGTAKFPPGCRDHVTSLGNKTYRYDGYVDSENSFGALLRIEFSMTQQKTDKGWELIAFVFDGEKIK